MFKLFSSHTFGIKKYGFILFGIAHFYTPCDLNIIWIVYVYNNDNNNNNNNKIKK